MNLLVVLITHNRMLYTRRTLRSLFASMEEPFCLVVVDNASTDGTKKYLEGHVSRNRVDKVVFNEGNLYPGKATNIGWAEGIKICPQATHLMRLDNDMHLERGWYEQAEEYFKKIPELGQLGIDYDAIDTPQAKLREMLINGMTLNPWPGCVGGPCIVRRSLWDQGLRYDEVRWDDGRQSKLQEDSMLSRKVERMGYLYGHMTEKLAWTFANESNWAEFPDYYRKTMTERGYDDLLKEAGL